MKMSKEKMKKGEKKKECDYGSDGDKSMKKGEKKMPKKMKYGRV